MNTQEYQAIVQHYEANNEDLRFETRWCSIEYLTTLRYIHRYLQPGARALEIGAGTGRYSIALAAQGYDVTAVELVPHNLDVLRSKITPDMNIQALEGNALHLDMLPDEAFDMTLLLGPLYHLFQDAEKQQAIAEALRVTKRGGIIMAAYCITDGPMINYTFRQGRYRQLLERGCLDDQNFVFRPEKGGFLFEHVRKADVDRLMSEFDVERLHYVATDGLPGFLLEELDEMEDETFRAVLRYHWTVCEHDTLADATAHSLDIFRKQSRVISLYSGENL